MKLFTTLLAAFLAMTVMAQMPGNNAKGTPMNRKYQVLVELEKPADIVRNNQAMRTATESTKLAAHKAGAAGGEEKGLFLQSLATGFGSALVQKTQNATSNLISVGVNYLVESMKSDRKKWYSSAQSHCTLTRQLKSETTIKDFYSAPSNLGAMDPQNIQFKGFGCRHFLEEAGATNRGEEVFFIFCSMRRDSLGLSSIVDHSKFLVEVDSLVFNPRHCGLPNDSLTTITPFDFSKRTNLTLTVKARIYSSWINEAIMVTRDQQLGEFTITARIDPSVLNEDSVFVYRKGDPRFERLVSVSGDSFIVPRSFAGTSDGTSYSRTWGTGQYRIEMDINESCKIVNDYYYKDKYRNEDVAVRASGNGREIAFSTIPEWGKLDKAKWKAEWTPIKSRKRHASFWSSAWNGIVTAYRGTGWVQTFTDPLTNVIINYEGQELKEWLGLDAAPAASTAKTQSGAASTGKAQSGATPMMPMK